jgi:uncharacterized membrane protein YqjE
MMIMVMMMMIWMTMMRMMMMACWVFIPGFPTVSVNTGMVLHLRVWNGGTHGLEDTEKVNSAFSDTLHSSLQNPRNERIYSVKLRFGFCSLNQVSGLYIRRGKHIYMV